MAKIHRKKPPKHLLVPDTNILWNRDKDIVVSPEFSKFWNDYGENYEIDLAIPEVVKGELLYQHTSGALKSLERANNQFNTLSLITNKKYSHRVSEGRVKKDVEIKINNWITSVNANIYQTPISVIDWGSLINDAIWRRIPFIEEKGSEKGFRDALILETVIDVANKSNTPSIAFITGDGPLRAAAVNRSKKIDKLTCYESLEEFSSVLRLMDEQLTTEFVKAIQNRAREKFNSSKPNCLLNRESISSKIRREFIGKFETPSAPQPGISQVGLGLHRSNKWEPATEEGVWIRPPSFVQLENVNEYIWKSNVLFVQLFRFTGISAGSLLGGIANDGDEKLRKVEFSVLWTAKVSKDGSFRKMILGEIEYVKTDFEFPTDAEKDIYNLSVSEAEN